MKNPTKMYNNSLFVGTLFSMKYFILSISAHLSPDVLTIIANYKINARAHTHTRSNSHIILKYMSTCPLYHIPAILKLRALEVLINYFPNNNIYFI